MHTRRVYKVHIVYIPMLRNALLHNLSLNMVNPSQYDPKSTNLTSVIIRTLVSLSSLILLVILYLLKLGGNIATLLISSLILHHLISSVLMLTFRISITQVKTTIPPSHVVVLSG